MIISRNALQIVGLCAPDKNVAALNCVCFEPDGSLIASNSKVWAWVSPLSEGRRKLVPLDDNKAEQRVVLSADAVGQIIKAIGKDTQFKGLLEHCDVAEDKPGTPGIIVTTTDGKVKHGMELRRVSHQFPEYQSLFAEAWASVDEMGNSHITLNRKRLSNVVTMADRVCSYDGQFAPMEWYFGVDGLVIMRTVNELTDQRLICLFSSSEDESENLSAEEHALFTMTRKAMKIL
jgi:hypothetical protein